MEETPKDRVTRLIRETANSKVTHIAEAAKRRGRSIAPVAGHVIQGNQNVVGNNNHVTIHVRPVTRPKVQIAVQANESHVSATQAFELQQLVAKVVQVTGKTYAQVWGAFRRKFLVPSYRLLAREQHDVACQYLRAWIASAEAREGAPAQPDRKRLLARIHAEGRKRADLMKQVRDFAQEAFGTRSLSELDADQLGQVIRSLL